jgi:hypothetical protein
MRKDDDAVIIWEKDKGFDAEAQEVLRSAHWLGDGAR